MVLYLDRYHLGDPLFAGRLARWLASRTMAAILVHGAGDEGERALEAIGVDLSWSGGVLQTNTAEQREAVERAARETNRRLTHALTDAGVSAVRADGSSRGLLTVDRAGNLMLGNTRWLTDLVRRGVTPVIAALAPDTQDSSRQVDGGTLTGLLAGSMGAGDAVFLVRKLPLDVAEIAVDALAAAAPGEPEAVLACLASGARTMLSTERGLSRGQLTLLRPST